MSTSTEKLSSLCHNQQFDTLSTNLGESLRFDHNIEKNVRHLFFGKYFTGGRCRLAWRVLTLIDENYRGEPHSCQMF